MQKRKKIKITILVAIASLIALLLISFLIFTFRTGRTSGTVSLFVDGERMRVDGVVVELWCTHFAYDRATDEPQTNMTRRVRNGRFSFNYSVKCLYIVSFTLNSNMWSDTNEEIHVEVGYFNSQSGSRNDFEINTNIMSERNMIEVFASDGRAYISSGEMPIELPYTSVYVYIPSP